MNLLKRLSLYQAALFSGICFAPFHPEAKSQNGGTACAEKLPQKIKPFHL